VLLKRGRRHTLPLSAVPSAPAGLSAAADRNGQNQTFIEALGKTGKKGNKKKAPFSVKGAFKKGAATYPSNINSTICASGLIRRGGSKWAKPNIY